MSAGSVTAPLDLGRLAKLLGLLSSHYDGEVLAAARKVEELRRAARVSWDEILSPTSPKPPQAKAPSPPPPRAAPAAPEIDIASALELCRNYSHLLSAWEADFIGSIWNRFEGERRGLTPRQVAVLERIARRCFAATRAKPKPKRHRRRRRAT